ncbi:DUF3375 domain-containing protein [Marichromatium bheemlicum]|uniref:DUF3375 domain-containing protein n=1 Tax=Marichromatium bheemlicum TaxID=365339 RepID=A0ABX1I3D6_9GAMM|nr:DUF3375 domain-containing protein [Marichromatium bheemlicum]NKN32032.1 DUF3375 domain-containing protein [Marichromatium bheemlicum]
MPLDITTLETLRDHHPAWRLLRSEHAPLVASFLHRVFIAPNVRVMAAADLAAALEDTLYALRQQRDDPQAFPRSARAYLDDWAGPDKGWLRKFYRTGSDEALFDLTPATEQAIAWLGRLEARRFVGTESRLLTLFDLLRQMHEGSETDPTVHLAELRRKRDTLDAEIERVRQGELPLLDETALRERFQQFSQLARELLNDFREVEHNLRQLDRKVRERITLWDGGKGELLEEIMGERDAIHDSDQGRSFRAFWDLLMSSRRQQELGRLLEQVLALPAIAALEPDARLRRVHYDWLEAGEHTQRTVAQLSQQLRRFLDDQAWLENRRIMDILRGIETQALALRETPPTGTLMRLEAMAPSINLPFERPLYSPPLQPRFDDPLPEDEIAAPDPAALFSQVVVDKGRLERHIRRMLHGRDQISLRELIETQPLRQGLAELTAYLQLGCETFTTVLDEHATDPIAWEVTDADGQHHRRVAQVPRLIFVP